jgi:hypothetical protein
MSAEEKYPTLPPRRESARAQEAAAASLDVVREIFGDPEDPEPSTTVLRLRNGGKARLQAALRRAGFQHLELEEAKNA